MTKIILVIIFLFTVEQSVSGQLIKRLFKPYIMQEIPDMEFDEILASRDGYVLISISEATFAMINGGNFAAFTIGLDRQDYGIKNLKEIFTGKPIKTITESSDHVKYFSTFENQITYFHNLEEGICDLPPFYFPPRGEPAKEITRLWFDTENNLFIGVTSNEFYFVKGAGNKEVLDPSKYTIGRAKDKSMMISKGELGVKLKPISLCNGVYAFADAPGNKNLVWVGTGNGLYNYSKNTGEVTRISDTDEKLTVTHIEIADNGDVWFSTMEKGMGVFYRVSKTFKFYPYPKKRDAKKLSYPIRDFCVIPNGDFFVAIADSVPAIFSGKSGIYSFINDSAFSKSINKTTDVTLDSTGNLYIIKGGVLFSSNITDHPDWLHTDSTKFSYVPLVYGVTDFKKNEITNHLTRPELLKRLTLDYSERSIIVYLTSNYFSGNKKSQFSWTLEPGLNNWVDMPSFFPGPNNMNTVEIPDLKPGKYNFRARVRVGNGEWSKEEAQMEIVVSTPFWQNLWFWLAIAGIILLGFYIVMRRKVNQVRSQQKIKSIHEKELSEMEAKALRAQMNPHFIFNCLNSIKALVQARDHEKANEYLVTFSKLIRTLFHNSDKRQISLYDEIQTCRLYTELEVMRLGDKLSYSFNIDPDVDLKSVLIPAMIIQPFIENAIWHGIVPKETGGRVLVSVKAIDNKIVCEVDDDGIGRTLSQKNKPVSTVVHESKGVRLSQARINLDKLLNDNEASIDIIDKYEGEKAIGTKVVLQFDIH